MYIINKHTLETIEVINPHSKANNSPLTNLQMAWKQISDSFNWAIQDTLPLCDKKYWYVNYNPIREMTIDEKKAVDKAIEREQKIIDLHWTYTERNIRIHLPESVIYTEEAYKDYAIREMLAKEVPFENISSNVNVYLTYVLKSDGFYLGEENNLVNIDPRMGIENLGDIVEFPDRFESV